MDVLLCIKHISLNKVNIVWPRIVGVMAIPRTGPVMEVGLGLNVVPMDVLKAVDLA